MNQLEDETTNSTDSSAKSPGKVPNGAPGALTGPLSLLQGLRECQGAWAPGSPWDRAGARAALWGRPAGSFLVIGDSSSQPNLLCMSVGGEVDSVRDFSIQFTGTGFHLAASQLVFPDLSQLVVFYTLSRDVLPLCLLVPSWVYGVKDKPVDSMSHLGPKSWLCPSSDVPADAVTPVTPHTVMCSIQLTAANGALCVINPLYLHEHGDDWLTKPSPRPQLANPPAALRRERLLSTKRKMVSPGLKKRGFSLDQEVCPSLDSQGSTEIQSQDPPTTPSTAGVVLRRASSSASCEPLRRVSGEMAVSPLPQSPHRVSWIEDNVWLNAPPPPTLLHPPSMELDSLSLSSVEDDTDSTKSPSDSPHLPRVHLADKVKNRLSAMGQALGGLVSPQRRLTKRVVELSERKGGAFAEAVRSFVEQTLGGGAVHGVTIAEMLQELRSSLTALREMLFDYSEIQSVIESMGDIPDYELDGMLEIALHKVALKPVYSHLYVTLQTMRRQDGSLPQLQGNQRTLESRTLEELDGTAGAGVPDALTLEKIQQRWDSMHQSYSPSKKVHILLKVCKTIYHRMSINAKPGVVFGADDFLPCLTWVLLRSDVATLQIDTDYMMELLDPSQLQGEGGYYLTSLYAALFYISSFRPRMAARQLSAEAHRSLSQWHRRRTLHCNQSRRSQNRRTFRKNNRSAEGRATLREAGQTSSRESLDSGDETFTTAPSGGHTETLPHVEADLGVVKEEEESVDDQQSDGVAQDSQTAVNREPETLETDKLSTEKQSDSTEEPTPL
ncbi:ras and Rab interactor 2 [Chanos chanos]|uniref:Ras and Rab interactor 2 n=1 Tax=Chanos chanos TaxID=29144 RepID=A0A6J2VLH3_CHACN|nr:ras and Rab interactor-like protein [Chanos chanos]